MKRKKYSPEFKREAIELVRRSGASCRQVALEIGVAPNLLTRWVREAQLGTEKAFPGSGSPRDAELDRLFRSRLEIGHVDSEMSGHALAKWPVTIYRNDRSRWAEIRRRGACRTDSACLAGKLRGLWGQESLAPDVPRTPAGGALYRGAADACHGAARCYTRKGSENYAV